MTVKIFSIGLKGLEGYRVQVQVSEGKDSETWGRFSRFAKGRHCRN